DNQKNVRDVIDNAGVNLDHVVYSSFGTITSETHPTVNLLAAFAGRPLDRATGFTIASGRAYDPVSGRFLQPDPAGLAAGDLNLYRSAGNDPASGNDTSQLPSNRPPGRPRLLFGLRRPLGPNPSG